MASAHCRSSSDDGQRRRAVDGPERRLEELELLDRRGGSAKSSRWTRAPSGSGRRAVAAASRAADSGTADSGSYPLDADVRAGGQLGAQLREQPGLSRARPPVDECDRGSRSSPARRTSPGESPHLVRTPHEAGGHADHANAASAAESLRDEAGSGREDAPAPASSSDRELRGHDRLRRSATGVRSARGRAASRWPPAARAGRPVGGCRTGRDCEADLDGGAGEDGPAGEPARHGAGGERGEAEQQGEGAVERPAQVVRRLR